jgi:hypothetical protein
VLAPRELEQTGLANWRDYYYANRHGFFFVFAAIWPLDVIDTLLKGKAHFIDQGPLYLPTVAMNCILSVIAGLTRNERFHGFWAVFFQLYQICYVAFVLLRLG